MNLYETGGLAALGSIYPLVIPNKPDGTLDLDLVQYKIPPKTEHMAQAAVLALENSQQGCSGASVPLSYVKQAKKLVRKNKLRFHLDGARLLNALVETGVSPSEYVEDFDTVSFCLSKGMGCPLGSVLLGTEKDIFEARNLRKMLGGGMRQAGLTASCALVALEDWQEKLAEDNKNARLLAQLLDEEVEGVNCDISKVQTNILVMQLDERVTSAKKNKQGKKLDHRTLAQILSSEHNIHVMPAFTNDGVRMVTHRDVNSKDMETVSKTIAQIVKEYL